MESIERVEKTGIFEVDRVLGGGAVRGSVTLLAGFPGVGKSTLLHQVLNGLVRGKLGGRYVSNEECLPEMEILKRRCDFSGYAFDCWSKAVPDYSVGALVVDSLNGFNLRPHALIKLVGDLVQYAIRERSVVFVTSKLTTRGTLSLPAQIEHLVHVVAYLESVDEHSKLRRLRVDKNRFGASGSEILELTEHGFVTPQSECCPACGTRLTEASAARLRASEGER